uniref:Chitin-binding type-2 domain-containing protein n=1 Tax=Anopheles farauti TaxID=69004 RepID=A0A182QVB1_9DIPT
MSGWPIITLLALVTLTVAYDLRSESCNRCGYRTGNQIQSHAHCATPNAFGGPKYFRDRRDCGKFYECNRGTAYEFICSEGLAFDEQTKVCAPESRVRCELDGDDQGKHSSGTSEPALARPQYVGGYEEPRASGAGQNRTASSRPQYVGGYEEPRASGAGQKRRCNICKKAKQSIPRHANCPLSNGYYPVMFRNAKDCTQFYQCDHGTAYLIQCPAGLHFNTHLNVCDYPRNVDCNGPVLNSAGTRAPNTGGSVGSHPGPSSQTCPICQSSKHMVRNHHNCPAKNGHYPVMFRHQSDCSKFYQCDHGNAFEIQCPAGLHFNTAINVCDYPRNVDCSDAGAPSVASPGGTSVQSPVVTSPSNAVEPKQHPNCPVITGRQEANYWAHPRDCGKYFGCQWGCVEVFSCPDGYLWDEEKKACAAERLVQCTNDGY